MNRSILLGALLAAAGFGQASTWTYQGTLHDGESPASGNYDLRLTLFDASGMHVVAAPVTLYDVAVSKGSFTAEVDFGVDFSTQHQLRLSTEVRQGNTGFVHLGEPQTFDPDGTAVCWGTLGNTGVALAIVGTNSPTDASSLRLRSRGVDILYLRGTSRSVEQGASTANGVEAAAWNYSVASGDSSFTVGHGSTSPVASSSFVYADGNGLPGSFESSQPDQFLVRANGGIAFNTTDMPSGLDDLVIGAKAISGDADTDVAWRTRSGKFGRIYLADFDGHFALTASNLSGATFLETNANGAKLTSGGVWTNGSSREYKQGFAAVDVVDVLHKVNTLPISTWTYKNSSEGAHVGPMAEDFKAAFGLGTDAQHIATVDADGVALAAIQGLYRQMQTQHAVLLEQHAKLLRRLELIEQQSVSHHGPVHE